MSTDPAAARDIKKIRDDLRDGCKVGNADVRSLLAAYDELRERDALAHETARVWRTLRPYHVEMPAVLVRVLDAMAAPYWDDDMALLLAEAKRERGDEEEGNR